MVLVGNQSGVGNLKMNFTKGILAIYMAYLVLGCTK
jgi:hypothetical protein